MWSMVKNVTWHFFRYKTRRKTCRFFVIPGLINSFYIDIPFHSQGIMVKQDNQSAGINICQSQRSLYTVCAFSFSCSYLSAFICCDSL